MHTTEAAGLCTAAHDRDDLRPARGILLGIGISCIAWLGLVAAIVAAVAS